MQYVDGQLCAALAMLESDDEDERTRASELLESGLIEASQQHHELFNHKADAYCYQAAKDRATAQWRRSEAKRLLALAEASDHSADRVQSSLINVLTKLNPGGTKFSLPAHEITSRSTTSTVVEEEDLVPAEFMRTPPVKSVPDKDAIKKALQSGSDVPGAHLETRRNWKIK